MQLSVAIDPHYLYEHFQYETASSPGLDTYYDEYARHLLAKVSLERTSYLLEIGSNDGTLLRAFQRLGVRGLGVEPAQEIALKASNLGVETVNAFFDSRLAKDIVSSFGQPAAIICNYTLANVHDLADFVSGVTHLMAERSVFVIETGYLLDLIRFRLFDNIYHEHISYFAIRPLAKFLEHFGLEIFDIEWTPAKGGAIRVLVRKKRESAPPAVLARFLRLEEIFGLDKMETYGRLSQEITGVKERLLAFLDAFSSAKIAGYGACHSATTLIYQFELGARLDFLVDDNAAKHYTYSPGFHLPVLPPRALYERNPDFVMILAWRYAQTIVKKHALFEGRFLLPMPEVCLR